MKHGIRIKISSRITQIFTLNLLLLLLFLFTAGNGLLAQVSNYTYSQLSGTYIPLGSGRTVVFFAAANATSDPGFGDDRNFQVTIPFTFSFNGLDYNTININTNGFVTFGSTLPLLSDRNGLSNSTAYSGCIAAHGSDLNANTNVTNLGEISVEALGTGTFRTFVIQYAKFRRFSSSSTFSEDFNFQIRLNEGNGIASNQSIDVVYGPCISTSSTATCQVGLRGPTNVFAAGNIKNQQNPTTAWNASIPGTANNSAMRHTTNVNPTNGLTFTWTPPVPTTCTAPTGLSSTNITSTSASLNWLCQGCTGVFRLEYNASPAIFGGTGNVVVDPATSPVLASGLLAGTSYSFFVRQNCGPDGFSNISGASFITTQPGESCDENLFQIPVYPNSGSALNTLLTTGLTQDGPDGDCSNSIGNPAKKDRWVKFIAPSNGNKLVISTSVGTLSDVIMQVWDSCPGTGSPIACEDDASQSNLMPEITICQSQYIGGQTYYVRIWPFDAVSSGNYNVKIYESNPCPPPPANDNCSNAISLQINPYGNCPASKVTGTTENSTTSIGMSSTSCDPFGVYNDVYYTFTTGTNSSIELSFNVNTGNSNAAVYSACNGSTVGCYSPGTNTIAGLLINTTYIVRVWSNPLLEGTFSICLNSPPVPACITNLLFPSNGSTSVNPCFTELSWLIADGASGYDVYLDPGPGPATTLVSSNQPGTIYPIAGVLGSNQLYSWRVEPKNETGTALGCNNNSFITSELSALPCYCSSVHANGCGATDEITHVVLNSLNKSSSCSPSGYSFFPDATTSLSNNLTYSLVVSFSSDLNQYFGAWIDFNQDGSLDSSEFLGASGNAGPNGSTFVTFTVPSNAVQGLTRLRIVGGNDSPVIKSQACNYSSSDFGETEDYDITILPASGVILQLKVFLEGIYMGNQSMINMLYNEGISAIPNEADSIVVDLWSASDLNAPYDSKRGVVYSDGTAIFIFDLAVLGNSFYIVVHHRNSIEIWTKEPVLFNGTVINYDFTSP